MTQKHPITPPAELVQQIANGPGTWLEKISKAYCAGADQELYASCEWLQDSDSNVDTYELRNARRPKPPTRKEQALAALEKQFAKEFMESTIPKAYRLIMRGDGNGNTLPALQGLFTWTEGSNYGAEWRTLETQECPYLDDSIPFGPIH